MKNRLIVPQSPNSPQLPDPPLSHYDVPIQPCAVIPQAEIVALANAHFTFQIARADYEKKRAAVTLKLLLCARPQEGDYKVELNRNGGLILTDEGSLPLERLILGEGNSQRPFVD